MTTDELKDGLVAALALVLVIGFGLLRTIQWGLGFFPTGSALGM